MFEKPEFAELLYKYIPENELLKFGVVKPKEKPLFVTEDGVEKFKGDSWFYINKHGDVKETSDFASSTPGFITKRFHDEKLAIHASIALHATKLFSLNDVIDLVKGYNGSKEISEKVRKLVYDNLK